MATVSADLETGDLSQFDVITNPGGHLSAHADAAKNGSYGLKCVMPDQTTRYGLLDFLNKDRLRLGLWFNPNSLTMANNDSFSIATGLNNGDFRLNFGYTTANGYRIRIGIPDDTPTWSYTTFFDITDDWHWFEIDLKISSAPGANDGYAKIWVDTVDATPDEQITAFDNDTRDFDHIQAGPVAGMDVGTSGTIYYDDINANDDGTPIGPIGIVTHYAHIF